MMLWCVVIGNGAGLDKVLRWGLYWKVKHFSSSVLWVGCLLCWHLLGCIRCWILVLKGSYCSLVQKLKVSSMRERSACGKCSHGEIQECESKPEHVSPVPAMCKRFWWSTCQSIQTVIMESKGIFSPAKMAPANTEVEMPKPSADHPGIEGVGMEEALEKCPHMKAAYEAQMKKKDSCPYGAKSASSESKCPVDHSAFSSQKGTQSDSAKCPYQNPEAHEWPMRAVLTFLAFNFLATGINIEFIKVCFVMMACYMGLLKTAEFAVIYVTTASMSSYKLLGLLLMLTNKGGPKWSWDLYKVTPATVTLGILFGFMSIGFGYVVKHGEIAWGMYRERKWTGPTREPYFSPLFHVLVPIINEFVYRHFMMTELGRDLGTWFGLLGSSVWFGILVKGSHAKLLARFFHGLFLGSATLIMKRNLLIPTLAQTVYLGFFALFPSFEWIIVR